MQKSIAAIVGAVLAVLIVTASVAAADPFGWRASDQATYGTSAAYASNGSGSNGNPAATTVPTAGQPAVSAPSAVRPSTTTTPIRHRDPVRSSTGTRMTQRQTTQTHDRHGSDWCDDYGRSDHGLYWH